MLGLNRAEVVAPAASMVDEIALSECLLEILTGLRLEASGPTAWMGLPVASTWTLSQSISRSVLIVTGAHDKVVSVDLASLS